VQVDEEHLVRRASAGDLDAFHLLYERNVDTVFGFLRNRVGPQRAEDLTADTFVKAFERIGGFEWRGIPIRAWLLRIAYNLIVAASRRPGDEVATEVEGAMPVTTGPEELVVDRTASSPALLALAQLPEAQQLVVQLRFLQELSVAETAAVIGSTDEAVRAQTYRALRNLRRTVDLAPPGGDDEG
jgi:RNA polymerase sigma factor (sigma-70 family)